ncbi:hypothetical protein HDU80_005717 [Chytriomyces hyalinus]|nr:hypothetical protein HDU80_005717 [Chytriomyces hyalinus]
MSSERRSTIYSGGATRPDKLTDQKPKSEELASSVSTLAASSSSYSQTNLQQQNNGALTARTSSRLHTFNLPEKNIEKLQKWTSLHNTARDSIYTISGDADGSGSVEVGSSSSIRESGAMKPTSARTFGTPLNDRLASIDETSGSSGSSGGETPSSPERAMDASGLKSQVSWSNIRGPPENTATTTTTTIDASSNSGILIQPPASKMKASESLSGLKRWHNVTIPAPEEIEQVPSRRISGASSAADHASESSSLRGSLAESEEYDEADSSGDADTMRSSKYSSNGSTENYTASDASSRPEAESTASQKITHEKPHWFSSSFSGKLKGSTDDHIATQPNAAAAGASKTFSSDLPSLCEADEDEPIKQKPPTAASSRHLPTTPSSNDAKQHSKPQPVHHQGIGSWKLPPLLKKMVYGDPSKAASKAEAAPRTVPQKVIAKAMQDTKKGSSNNNIAPSSSKSYLPVPVAASNNGKLASKPSTANIMHAVKHMSILGKPRFGSEPGLGKDSSSGSASDVPAAVSSSSKTLAAASDSSLKRVGGASGSVGTIWDDEDVAREMEAELGLSDEQCFMAAKIRFEAKYKVQKQLGAGGHSTVRLATRTYDNKPVVCKFIKHSSVWHWHNCSVTGRQHPMEIQVMRKFSKLNNGRGHPNLINYYEHFELNGKFYIIMEYMGDSWVDLYDYIELYGPVREEVSLEIFKSVVETLVSLHDLGFYHNDIKDENILIHTKTRQIKLIDFGSATAVPKSDDESPNLCENFYGTKKFAAPEALQGDPYEPEMQETWALGTLLFVLLFKLDPFTTDEEIVGTDIGRRIAKFRAAAAKNGPVTGKQRGSHDNDITGVLGDLSDDVMDALVRMMEKDPKRRIKVKDILKLPALRKIKKRAM